MPSVQVRDLPDAIYRKLVDRAQREHRSLSQQATILLANALDVSPQPKKRRQLLLQGLSDRPLVQNLDTVPAPESFIREDRQR